MFPTSRDILPARGIARLGVCLCIVVPVFKLVLGSNEANLRLQQVIKAEKSTSSQLARGIKQPIAIYPDYCWFIGLENRILAEYPELGQLIQLHHDRLYKLKDLQGAAELHRKLFGQIYALELAKQRKLNSNRLNEKEYIGKDDNDYFASDKDDDNDNNDNADELDDEARSKILSTGSFKAAYKLFDLWSNTPSDYEQQRGDYSNYLDSYLTQSRVEFWSYCFDNIESCRLVLGQLIVLAKAEELGPIELLQVSNNIIMLMNSYKADLVLGQLIDRQVIKLEHQQQLQINNGETGSSPSGNNGVNANEFRENDEEDSIYKSKLNDIVELIETDDDFNEATFHYVFSGADKVHMFFDPELETYLADRIAKRAQMI